MARSSSAAETEAAADGDDEVVYIRLCLKEVLFGQLDLQNWQSEARQIPAALWWTVVVSTTLWLALRPLILAKRDKPPTSQHSNAAKSAERPDVATSAVSSTP